MIKEEHLFANSCFLYCCNEKKKKTAAENFSTYLPAISIHTLGICQEWLGAYWLVPSAGMLIHNHKHKYQIRVSHRITLVTQGFLHNSSSFSPPPPGKNLQCSFFPQREHFAAVHKIQEVAQPNCQHISTINISVILSVGYVSDNLPACIILTVWGLFQHSFKPFLPTLCLGQQ